MKRSGNEFEDTAKRMRSDAEPSRVLHVRGLPMYTTESELIGVVSPYGQVIKCLLLTDKHQGFIQMESADVASEVLQQFAFSEPSIRSKTIYFQFSTRKEVEIRNQNVNANSDEGSTTVILITIVNVTVPISLDNIYQICKPYGDILKIITFTKNIDFQALVQFGSVESASEAKDSLEGKDLFQGCCHIRVGFSKRTSLVVKVNDHKCRDFTLSQIHPPTRPGNVQNLLQLSDAGGIGGGFTARPGNSQGALQMHPHLQASGGLIGSGPSLMGSDGIASGMGMRMGMSIGGVGTVVLVNKLVEDKITADILFTLFGVYGDVTRVKILFNKRQTALIQYTNSQQADFAVANLNHCVLHGQAIVVQGARIPEIKLPRDLQDQQQLTKDYTGSLLHRFRKKTFMNPKNMNPPSQVLHVANLHENATEEELVTLFGSEQEDSEIEPIVEFFKKTRRVAYVCMASVPHAVSALINLHNYKQLNNYPLRVSFSHKDPGSIIPSQNLT